MAKILRMFSGGMNKDTEPRQIPNNQYRDALNADLTDYSGGEGFYAALTQMRGMYAMPGSVPVDMPTVNVLGMFEVRAMYDYDCTGEFFVQGACDDCTPKEMNDSIVLFVWDAVNGSRVLLYDLVREQLHILLQNSALDFHSQGSVDAVFTSYRGVPELYWDDDCNELRRLDLRWSCSPTWTAPTIADISVRSMGLSGCVMFSTVMDGGQLLAGTYQIGFRLFNSQTCRYSSWSLPSNPIPVVPNGCDSGLPGNEIVGGSVGQMTNRQICVLLDIDPALLPFFDQIQLYIIKHTTSAIVEEDIVYVLDPSSDYYANAMTGVCYTGAEGETTMPASEVFIEDASVLSAKTLQIKDGRLFRGNVRYSRFEYDNGVPSFVRACTITTALDADYAYDCEPHTALYRGYWRGEVYRFGIVYQDKWGNWGEVCPFDFSGQQWNLPDAASAPSTVFNMFGWSSTNGYTLVSVLGNYSSLVAGDWVSINGTPLQVVGTTYFPPPSDVTMLQIAGNASWVSNGMTFQKLIGQCGNQGTSRDWKFPERCANQYTLFDTDGRINPIGLRIEGITNHPSWAVAFAIVRMPRIKNILWQTPHIPGVAINGVNTPVPSGITYIADYEDYKNKQQDFFAPKKHISGVAQNIGTHQMSYFGQSKPVRQMPVYRRHPQPSNLEPVDNFGSPDYLRQFDVPPICFCIPPEYVFNHLGEPYQNYESSNEYVRIVDAVQFGRKVLTPTSLVDLASVALTSYALCEAANAFLAVNRSEYFYTREGRHIVLGNDTWFGKLPSVILGFGTTNLEREFTKIKQSYRTTLNQSPFAFAYAPMATNPAFGHIIMWANDKNLSIQQGQHPSVVVSHNNPFGKDAAMQRGLVLVTELPLLDFTFRVAGQWVAGSANYFPLSTKNWIDRAFEYDTLPDAEPAQYGRAFPTTIADGGDATANVNACSAAYILNVERGLGDARYGSPDAGGDYQFTGVCERLTPSDIANNTPFTVDIWGGDCFISRAAIKVANSHAMPLSYLHPLLDWMEDNGVEHRQFWKTGTHQDNVEYLELYLESEVNSAYGAEKGVYPETGYNGAAISLYNQPHNYPYHFGYSAQNTSKVFQGKRHECANERGCYPARVVWSDARVLASDISGFDRFRQLSAKDLPEEYGEIVKLTKTSNEYLWAIQRYAIVPLPVGARNLEMYDNTTLVVGAPDTVMPDNIRHYATTRLGSQHIRTIQNIGDAIYGIDAKRRKIWRLAANGAIAVVSELGMDSFFKFLQETMPEKDLAGWYDYERQDYWAIAPNEGITAAIFAEKINAFKTRFHAQGAMPLHGCFAGQALYSVNAANGELKFWRHYDVNAPMGYFYGTYHPTTWRSIFYDGVQEWYVDVLSIDATNRVSHAVASILDEANLQPNQVTMQLLFNKKPQRAIYFQNLVKDQISRARLRGRVLVVDYTIVNPEPPQNVPVRVTSVAAFVRTNDLGR